MTTTNKSKITLEDCHCPLGKYTNQKGYVVCVYVAMYHDLDCPIRKRINSSEYGYNT
jgi:hypothetical protein